MPLFSTKRKSSLPAPSTGGGVVHKTSSSMRFGFHATKNNAATVMVDNTAGLLETPKDRSDSSYPAPTCTAAFMATTTPTRMKTTTTTTPRASKIASSSKVTAAAAVSAVETSVRLTPSNRKDILRPESVHSPHRSPHRLSPKQRRSEYSPKRNDESTLTTTPLRNAVSRGSVSTIASSPMTPSLISLGDGEEGVRVCVRIRPLSSKNDNNSCDDDADDGELHSRPRAYVVSSDGNNIIVPSDESARYTFDRVYGESSTTLQLYDDMVADIVESVIRHGRNGTVFTYGQTSTGKTHTMHGILMAAGRDLFGITLDTTGASVDDTTTATTARSLTTIKISCMELYNEEVRDLLVGDNNATQSLPIQEDRRGNVHIPGLIERIVFNIEELMNVVNIAEGNRTIGSTAMNERSSRSHTIFRITYERREVMLAGLLSHDDVSTKEGKENDNSVGNETSNNSRTNSSQKVITTVSNLNLVDLAGSESARVTGATGDRQKEGGKINQSLLTLSTVLSKLGKKDGGHINYRDSKLTRILKPSLLGNARMGCICCISPDVKYVEESKSTLDFATRTMLVTTNAKSNTKVDYDDGLVKEFEMEIERIKNETAKSEASRVRMEDEIICLKANMELAIGKASRVERENKDFLMKLEELQVSNENDRNILLKEICILKSRNHDLETKVFHCESEKTILAQRQEDDCKSLIQKQKQIETLQFTMEEKEHELQLLRNDNTNSISKLTDQVSELERLNKDLREQLATAVSKSNSSHSEDNAVPSLTSTIDTLTREKLHLESMLAREVEKSTARRMEAKERRQKFKGKLAGMAETLKDGK